MKVRVRGARAKEGARWDSLATVLWRTSRPSTPSAPGAAGFPLEAGVAPGFAVLDEREAARLRDEVVDAFVYGEPPETCRDALVGVLRMAGVHELKNTLERLSSRREAAEQFFAALAGSEETVLDAWRMAVERCRKEELTIFGRRRSLDRNPAGPRSPLPRRRRPGPGLPPRSRAAPPSIAAGECGRLGRSRRSTPTQSSGEHGKETELEGDDLDRLRDAYKTLNTCLKAHGDLSLAIDPETRSPGRRSTTSVTSEWCSGPTPVRSMPRSGAGTRWTLMT